MGSLNWTVCIQVLDPNSLVPNDTRLRKTKTIFRHDGARPRRAMFITRTFATANDATTEFASVGRCSLQNAKETPLHADKPHGGEELDAGGGSGCEHSSTETSSAVGGRTFPLRNPALNS